MKKLLLVLACLLIIQNSIKAQKFGGALRFDGIDDKVTITNQANLNTTVFTIELWFKTEGTQTNTAGLIDKSTSGPTGYNIYFDNGSPQKVVGNAGNINAGGTSGVSDDQWHHVAFVRDGSFTDIYVDGNRERHLSSGAYPVSSVDLVIGASQLFPAYFKGLIDEVRISNVARYSGSSFTVPNAAFTNDVNTMALYHFDETTGAAAFDASLNRNTGKLTGGGTLPQWHLNGTPPHWLFESTLYLDGADDKLVIPNNNAITQTQFTIEFWFKTDGRQSDLAALVSKVPDNFTSGYFLYFDNDSPQKVQLILSSSSGSQQYTLGAGSDGQWHHVVFQRGDTFTDTYFDGVRITHAANSNFDYSTVPLTIGDNQVFGVNFKGWIEEFRVSAVQRYNNNSFTLPTVQFENEPGFNRVLTHFDDSFGSTATDIAGTGFNNNAVLTDDNTGSEDGNTPPVWYLNDMPLTNYTISGNTISNALLNYTDLITKTLAADGSGNYSFIVPYKWLGTVTPSKTNTTFYPASRTYNKVLSNQVNQNYSFTTVAEPTVQASNITFSSVGSYSMTLNWDNGNGANRIVLIKSGAAVDAFPGDINSYTANSIYGTGSQIGAGNYVVYNGASDSVTVIGLSANTTYHFAVVEYNGTGSDVNYLTTSPAVNNQPTPPVSLDAAPGSALKFDGTNDYLNVPYNASLNPSEFTYELWARVDGGQGTFRSALSSRGNLVGIQIYAAADNNWLAMAGGGDTWNSITGPAIQVGVWTHLAVTYTSGTMRFYVNGVLAGSLNFAYTVNTATPFRLGSISENLTFWFNGAIDEVRVWNAARTASEIRGTIHNTLLLSETGLVAYWQLNSNGSNVIANEVVNNYNGTANNFSFNASSGWIASTVPTGGGTSAGTTSFTTGTANLGNISLTMTNGFDNAVDITGVQINSNPNLIADGFSEVKGSRYFVVNTYGIPGTFAADLTLTYGAGVFDSGDEANPGRLLLFKRNSTSDGSWSFVTGASVVNQATGEITFNGITGFSQFVVFEAASEPSMQASTLTISEVGNYSLKLNWTNGNGTERIVLIKAGGPVDASPADFNLYTANSVFESGSEIGSGNYVIYNNSSNSVTVTGLSPGIDYHFAVFEHSGTGQNINYLTTSPAINNQSTVGITGPGNAVKFDGSNDYMNVPYSALLNPSVFTYELWARVDGGQGSFRSALSSRGNFVGIQIYAAGDNTWQAVAGGGGTWNAIIGPAIQVAVWTHLAVTYSSGTMKLYVNGVLAGSLPFTLTVNTANAFRLGSISENLTFWFNGAIDEVRVWNVARTITQIRESMNNTLAGSETGLAAYWQLNNTGTATNCPEVKAGRNGTLNNFNFNASSGWIESFVPTGVGVSASTTSFSAGTASLGNISFTTTNNFDNAVDITAAQVNNEPNIIPDGFSETVGSRYFVINTFGTPGTFAGNLTFSFGPGILDPGGDSHPEDVYLYRRSSNSEGAWTQIAEAISVNSAAGTATFEGINSFSQFIVLENPLLPVELSTFTVTSEKLNAELKWRTETETDNYGFEIEKQIRSPQSSDSNQSQKEWEKAGFVKGYGTSNSPKEYRFKDKQLIAGKYIYRLKQIDNDGTFNYSEEIEVEIGAAPLEFNLAQNYPNPFNPETLIEFTLPDDGIAAIKIYDIIGEEVAVLFNEFAEAGKYYQVRFNGSHLASGIYFARLQFRDKTGKTSKQMTKKMLMIK